MISNLFRGIIILSVLIFAYSCGNDEPLPVPEPPIETDEISADTLAINQWIDENMSLYYLWNNRMPDIDYTKENDPEAYFYKLLYTGEDKWSWITDDYQALNAEFSGSPVTMGYDPSFFLFSEGSGVFIVVNYVYPNSPAEDAGLKRGDIILSIDNTDLDTINYYDLYSGDAYSVQLGEVSGNSIGRSGVSMDLTASVISNDPAIYHQIITEGDKKIGYLVYVEFVAGSTNQFLASLDNIFTEFNTAGITDLIVDLRFNPGGEITAASYLASAIAPVNVSANQEVLVNMKYNTDLQYYLEAHSSEYESSLSYRFTNNVVNANMDRVYFLTTNGTASASELLISGLKPYMDVVHIGEATYGKYTGAWVMPDDDEKWAMVPIVMKYANIDGYTDFKNGLTPDYVMEYNPLVAVPFGDTSDPMLAQAINLITGGTTAIAATKSARVKLYGERIVPKKMILKKNLFVPGVKKELVY